MAVVVLDAQLSVSTHNPKIIQINDSKIIAMAETFMTITFSVSIGPHKCGTTHCKLDTGVSGNAMPICVFQKLFAYCIMCMLTQPACNPFQLGPLPIMAHPYPQLRSHNIPIKWTPWPLRYHAPCVYLVVHCRHQVLPSWDSSAVQTSRISR